MSLGHRFPTFPGKVAVSIPRVKGTFGHYDTLRLGHNFVSKHGRRVPDDLNRHIQKPLQRPAQKTGIELGLDGVGVTFWLLCSDIVIFGTVIDISRSISADR